jgi:RNA polymerase sigma-70 factor (ECF subfamily)
MCNTKTDLKTLTIADLVKAAQTGDRAAFGELTERYYQHVLSVGYARLGDYDQAQDLCQDVFLKALVKIDQLRDPRCFGGWLRAIANHMAINRCTRRAPVTSTEPTIMEATCVEFRTPLHDTLERERDENLRANVDGLRELDREMIHAFYFRDQSLREISEDCQAPVGTIKRRLHTARQRLSSQLCEAVAV